MKVLITGASGFIGSTLADKFREDWEQGHEPIGLDVREPVFTREHLEDRVDPGRHVRINILDTGMLVHMLRELTPDVVVHLAAIPGVRASVSSPAATMRVNVEGTACLLDALRDFPKVPIVLASSSSVYGDCSTWVPDGGGGPMFKEPVPKMVGAELVPESPYAVSKLAAECLVREEGQRLGRPYAIARLFTVYGPRGREDMAIRRWMGQLRGGVTPSLYGANGQRDFTYVDDVVLALQTLAEGLHYRTEGFGQALTLNVSTGKSEAVGCVCGKLGILLVGEERFKLQDEQAGDVRTTWGDNTDLRRILGDDWKPTWINEGLERTTAWFTQPRP